MAKRNEGYNSIQGYYENRTKTKPERREEALQAFVDGIKKAPLGFVKGVAKALKGAAGIEGKVSDHLLHRINPATMFIESAQYTTDKIIPQGADEAANVLFSGSAYLPWPGNGGPQPISRGECDLVGPSEPAEANYLDQLDQAARRGRGNDQGHTR